MTPAFPTALLPVALPLRNDFSERLSPILVKELRQGLQSRLFVSGFVLVQVAMILFVGLRLLSLSDDRNDTGVMLEGFFSFCVWVPLLIFMPARGLGAVGEEVRAQTLDLVQLTRLSAFRIVLGKWLALVAQTCLLATAMLPYAVLRYYFGQMDVVGEMSVFGTVFVASMVLTAAAVAISSGHVAVRIMVLILVAPMLVFYASALFLVRGYARSGLFGVGTPGLEALWIIPAAALYTYFFLELAASRIAPAAENHAARKRLLALVLAGVGVWVGWVAPEEAFYWVMAAFSPILLFTLLEALCEMPVLMPGLYRPFALRGVAGRLAGRVFYPGWGSGTLFTALVMALAGAAIMGMSSRFSSSAEDRMFCAALAPLIFAALMAPLPFLQLFPRLKKRFWPYMLVQVVSVLFFIVVVIISQSTGLSREDEVIFDLITPVPTATLFTFLGHGGNRELRHCIATVSVGVDAALLLWLALGVYRQFRVFRGMERLALGEEAGVSKTPGTL